MVALVLFRIGVWLACHTSRKQSAGSAPGVLSKWRQLWVFQQSARAFRKSAMSCSHSQTSAGMPSAFSSLSATNSDMPR